MDYIIINSEYKIPYPNEFKMQKTANIVSEYTTCTGKKLCDFNGWTYEDAEWKWDTLEEIVLQNLLEQTDPRKGTFTLTFKDTEKGIITINAYRRNRAITKTRYRRGGNWVWKDVTLTVSFPDAFHD